MRITFSDSPDKSGVCGKIRAEALGKGRNILLASVFLGSCMNGYLMEKGFRIQDVRFIKLYPFPLTADEHMGRFFRQLLRSLVQHRKSFSRATGLIR